MLVQAESRMKIHFQLCRGAAQLRILLQPLIFRKVGVVFFLKNRHFSYIYLHIQMPLNTPKTVAKFPIFPLYLKNDVKFLKFFLAYFQQDTNDFKISFSK